MPGMSGGSERLPDCTQIIGWGGRAVNATKGIPLQKNVCLSRPSPFYRRHGSRFASQHTKKLQLERSALWHSACSTPIGAQLDLRAASGKSSVSELCALIAGAFGQQGLRGSQMGRRGLQEASDWPLIKRVLGGRLARDVPWDLIFTRASGTSQRDCTFKSLIFR